MTDMIEVRRRLKDDAVAHLGNTPWLDAWWKEFGAPDLRKVFEEFGMEAFRRSSCLDGFDAFVRRSGFSGRCCLEIGTCKGLTAIALSRHFDRVISLDIERDAHKREYARACGRDNIRFFDVQDNEDKARLIAGLEFDAAYCDGDHAYDAQSDFGLVEQCGRVLFHEYWPLQPSVWELVNRLRASGEVQTHSNFALWTRR